MQNTLMTTQDSPGTLKGELAGALLSVRRAYVAVAGFSLAINLLLFAPAIYMLQIYDRVLASRNEFTLVMLTLIILFLLGLSAILELVRWRVLIRAGVAIDLRLNSRVFDASFERRLEGHGNTGQTLADLASLRQFATGQGLVAFFDAPWTPIYLAAIFLLSPWLGLFSIVGAACLIGLAYLNQVMTGRLIEDAGQAAGVATANAATQLRNAEVIEALGMLENLRKRWINLQTRFLSIQSDANNRAAIITSVTRLARLILQCGILGLGALLVIENHLSAGGMIAASILLGRALTPVEMAIASWRSYTAARGAFKRLATLLDDHPPREQPLPLPRPEGAISAENLHVAPPQRQEAILKGLNFRVPAGTLVAIIGPSASGKSTLARALVGAWGPLSGSVRLDGADVHTWDKTQLGPWIGYLPQDIELFDGTIAENIARFGDSDPEQIVLAGKRAGVHEMILLLPKGYDTRIGEGGLVLSGGQRQRIGLARALYGNPSLIVLDEPNSNLDSAGDAALLNALHTMKQERRTAIVITHRINILRVADNVMALVNGTIQAYGPRDAVIKTLSAAGPGNADRSGNGLENAA